MPKKLDLITGIDPFNHCLNFIIITVHCLVHLQAQARVLERWHWKDYLQHDRGLWRWKVFLLKCQRKFDETMKKDWYSVKKVRINKERVQWGWLHRHPSLYLWLPSTCYHRHLHQKDPCHHQMWSFISIIVICIKKILVTIKCDHLSEPNKGKVQ